VKGQRAGGAGDEQRARQVGLRTGSFKGEKKRGGNVSEERERPLRKKPWGLDGPCITKTETKRR